MIAPFAMEQIMKELKEAQFISVMVDSSSHANFKLVPLMVRFYHPDKGIVVRVLEIVNFGTENAEQLTSYVLEVLEKFDLKKKVVAISADNTNTNYGGKKRKGKNNLYFKLQEKSENNLIGIGCPAHIVHNAVQTGADSLPIDIQLIIGKIYQHFHIYAARVEKLKSFCEFVEVEYKKLLGHSKTRWLSLLPAVESHQCVSSIEILLPVSGQVSCNIEGFFRKSTVFYHPSVPFRPVKYILQLYSVH